MAKYMYVYKGPATDMKNMSREEAQHIMEAWKQWMQNVGEALVEVGQPMTNCISLVDDGSEGNATQLNGYSIVEAENIEAARNLAADHPFLSEGKGNFAIDIYELMPAPM